MIELSVIETTIIRKIAVGKATKEISDEVGLTESTIETYRVRLFRKLQVKNAPHLIARAFDMGVLVADKQSL